MSRVMPITGWVAFPVLISSSATRLPWLIGMAKPSPMEPDCPPSGTRPLSAERMAELMPITRPLVSSSGPPELPGLIGASVCSASTYDTSLPSPFSPPAVMGRSRALMMPEVTVPARSKGAPMATTGSPTWTLSELPSGRGLSPRTPFTRTTARS